MKISKLLVVLILIQIWSVGVSNAKKNFKFHKDGSFKIVQFTDVHFKVNSPKCELVIEMMNNVLDEEKPDLVVFTGDLVTCEPLTEGWKQITAPLVKREIPWAVTLGNHDDESDKKREEIFPIIKDISGNVSIEGDKNVHGYGNYIIPIESYDEKKVASLIYCMDSNAYSKIEGVGYYDWFRASQINWYQKNSSMWTKKNKGRPIPSLAFFHIPLVEYTEAWENGDKEPVGVKNEDVCSARLNSGMFAAMVQQGDVMGVFVGHDHDNDYLASLYNIALAYGRFSGGHTYGKLENGGRVIVLKEGERQFTTWLRLRGGQRINEVTYKSDKVEVD